MKALRLLCTKVHGFNGPKRHEPQRGRRSMLTVGVDLGKRKSQFAVVDEQGKVLVERKLPNQRTVIEAFLHSLPKPIQVGCETCLNSYWLVDILEELNIPIHVGHALKLKLIAQSRVKTDKVDARVIAQLLRVGFFPDIAIPPRSIRQVRELLRGRVALTRSATQAKNRLHGLLTRAGIDYERAEAFGAGAEAWLDTLPISPEERFMAQTYLGVVRTMQKAADDVKQKLTSCVMLQEPWASTVRRLMTIPGVGLLSALLFVLELWDISRFPTRKHLASYVGIVPSVSQSGQRNARGGPLTRQGNRYIRWILVQDAWVATRSCKRYRGMHEHYLKRQGNPRAIIPIARQILFDVYEMWRNGITYEELLTKKEKKETLAA